MRQAASLPSEAKLSGLRQFDRITKRCSRNLNLVFNVLLWIHRYKHQLKSKRLVLVLLKLKSRRLHPNLVFKSERETFTSLGSCSILAKRKSCVRQSFIGLFQRLHILSTIFEIHDSRHPFLPFVSRGPIRSSNKLWLL